jgi:hypothetical protein
VARSTDFVTSGLPDADLILMDQYNKCEHGYVVLVKEPLCSFGHRYGLRSGRLIVLVLLMSVLQMDNCMNMYVFGVFSVKNNDVGRLF